VYSIAFGALGHHARVRFNQSSICHQPNRAVKRTPTRAMASPLSWPLLVPCAPSVLRRRLLQR